MHIYNKSFSKYVFSSILAISIALALPLVLSAATLFVTPASSTPSVGETFSVTVYVASTDQSINALSGVLNFSRTSMEVVSISKNNSIVNFWAKEPTFSNQNGTIEFEGVVFNPGFTGAGGRVLTINFRPKAEGSTTLDFRSGSVLANDGLGTNTLSGMTGGTYTIGPAKPLPISTPKADKAEDKGILHIPTTAVEYREIGYQLVQVLSVVVPLLAMVILLVLVLAFGFYRFKALRSRIKRETEEAEESVHKAFGVLEEDAPKKQQKDLRDAERYISKEIRDIEKGL